MCQRSNPQPRLPTPTLYWRGSPKGGPKKTYHIDYAFIPDAWLDRLDNVSLGCSDEWVRSGLSDHVPLIVDIAGECTAPSAVPLSGSSRRWWDA
jgi:hypothetical protein